MNETKFPEALLTAIPTERFNYFHNWHVEHPHLIQAKDKLKQAIRYAGERRVIHLFGCTGVGKTTLCTWVEKILNEEFKGYIQQNPDVIPVAHVITPSPDQGPFNWRDVYVQTMHALGEPKSLIAKKQPNHRQFIPEGKLAIAPTMPRQELRLAMTGCLHMRHVQVLFYDDAQHFQMVAKAQRLQDQMDNLKWLSDVTGTIMVLVGTYDLLNLIDLNGQLARRSATIHFERYHAANKKEFKQFASVVYAFQKHLPLAAESSLIDHCEYLYERSLGCVGLLKELLEQALAQALELNENSLTEKRLESCVDIRKLVTVAKEAVSGDQRAYNTDGLHTELKNILKSASRIPVAAQRAKTPASENLARRQPGQRLAKRDLVDPGVLANG